MTLCHPFDTLPESRSWCRRQQPIPASIREAVYLFVSNRERPPDNALAECVGIDPSSVRRLCRQYAGELQVSFAPLAPPPRLPADLTKTARARIAVAELIDSGVPFVSKDVAARLGISKPTMSLILREFRTAGRLATIVPESPPVPNPDLCPECGAVRDGPCAVCELALHAKTRAEYELFGLVPWFGPWAGTESEEDVE